VCKKHFLTRKSSFSFKIIEGRLYLYASSRYDTSTFNGFSYNRKSTSAKRTKNFEGTFFFAYENLKEEEEEEKSFRFLFIFFRVSFFFNENLSPE